MRKYIPLLAGLLMLFPFLSLSAQYGGELAFYLDTEIAHYGNGSVISPGLRVEAFVTEYVSLNWRFAPGFQQGRFESFHLNIGLPVSLWVLSTSNDIEEPPPCDICDPFCPDYDPWLCDNLEAEEEDEEEGAALAGKAILAILALGLPEGITIHGYLNENISVSPYINPIGLEWVAAPNADDSGFFTITTDVGARFRFTTDEGVSIFPYGGCKYRYRSRDLGWTYGIGIGKVLGM